MRKIMLALAAASLVATPVIAQQAPPAAPAPAAERVNGNQLNGGYIIPLVLVVAAILAILAATHSWPFKRHPVSP
jgi:hypothetical protein